MDACFQMDRRISKGTRLPWKHPSGCACASGATEPLPTGSRMSSRRASVAKAAMPPPEQVSSSGDRIMSAVDDAAAGDERINRAGECAGGHCKDSDTKGRRRSRHVALTDISCGRQHPKSRGSHGHGHGLGFGLGCRSVAGLRDESLTLTNERSSVKIKESAETVVNQKFIDGENSKQFMEALYILNSNKRLFVKLLEDPNSFLAKHIQELRESRGNGRNYEAASEAGAERKGDKDECSGTLSPGRLKLWQKLLLRRSVEKDKPCDIVILKPGLENEHSGGKEGSHIGSGGGSRNGIRTVEQSRLPFGSIRKASKHRTSGNHDEFGELGKGGNKVSRVQATRNGEDAPEGERPAITTSSYKCKELDREGFIRRLCKEDQGKVLPAGAVKRFEKHDSNTGDARSYLPRDYQMSGQCKPVTDKERRSRFGISSLRDPELVADPTTLMEPDDQLQRAQIVVGSTNFSIMSNFTRSGKYDTSDDQSSRRVELECIEIAKRSIQDVSQEQTVSSSDDFQESETSTSTSTSDRAEEERSSPVSVLENHVAHPVDPSSKPERPRPSPLGDDSPGAPPDKVGQTTEFVKSILISSGLSWDAILPDYDPPIQHLTSYIVHETESGILQPGIDARLLCDYASEVLGEAATHRWRSYQLGRAVDGNVTSEVMNQMDWDLVLLQPAQQMHELESIIRRDLTKGRTWWMQFGRETDEIAVELTGMIIEDVVDEMYERSS